MIVLGKPFVSYPPSAFIARWLESYVGRSEAGMQLLAPDQVRKHDPRGESLSSIKDRASPVRSGVLGVKGEARVELLSLVPLDSGTRSRLTRVGPREVVELDISG